MKTEQIQQVLSIYQAGSINKAAQNLYISQPCLSSSIRALEKSLGQKIFIRKPSGITLTPFGEIFVKHGEEIMHHAEIIQQMANTIPDQNMEFSISVSYLRFPQLIFHQLVYKYQEALSNFQYRQTSVSNVVHDVHNHKTYLGIVSFPDLYKDDWIAQLDADHLCYETIFSGPPQMMFSQSHTPSDPIQYRQSSPMITFEEYHPVLKRSFEEIANILGAKTLVRVNDFTTVREFLKNAHGFSCVSFCPQAYRKYAFFNNMSLLPIENPTFNFEIGWIYRKDVVLPPLVQEFKDIVDTLLTE